MNGDVLANVVSTADAHPAWDVRPERKILRFAPNDRAIADHVLFAQFNVPADDRVCLNRTAVADFCRPFYHSVGAYRNVSSELGLRMNNGSWMNQSEMGRSSQSLIWTSGACDSQPGMSGHEQLVKAVPPP
jgi:hypothetical protein